MDRRTRRTATRALLVTLVAAAVLLPVEASTVRMVCLVVDLEGDGLRLGDREYPVDFDVDGDGLTERVQWTAQEQREGFLWLDANRDRQLQPDELVGRRLATPDGNARDSGWRALARLDDPSEGGNGDSRLTRADRSFNDLRLWIDFNHDGDPDSAELYRLEDWGIDSFALEFAEGLKIDGALNLETAWAPVTVRGTSRSGKKGVSGTVTEVHLPLLSVPTAVATPGPVADAGDGAAARERVEALVVKLPRRDPRAG